MTFRTLAKTAAIAATAVLATAPAQAQMVDATAPGVLADLLRQEGYAATLETDSAGDPLINSSSQGVNWKIWFYGCDSDGRYCKEIQFSVGFDKSSPISASRINEWNREKRFGKAYVDEEGDPFLEHNITLQGGVSRSNFIAAFEKWDLALGQYLTFIDWK